jgi:hypothetical protein
MIFLLSIVALLQVPIDTTLNQPTAYQSLEYQIKNRNFSATFDPSSGDIYLYHRIDRTFARLTEESTVDTLGSIPQDFDGLDYMDISSDGESIYFWEKGIGRVHRYDVDTGTIEREDTSHSHRTMFGTASFLSDDNFIYAIGGYGYWEFRNFLIRYEPEFGQWEKIPSLNDDLVVRSWKGLLYKLGDTFYYFVDNTDEDGTQKTHAYRFNISESTWYKEHELEDIFEPFKIQNRGVSRTFSHQTTYMVDENNSHFAFLSSSTQNTILNFISVDDPAIYQLNLNLMGISDVRAIFYSDRIDRWIILGHEFSWTERSTLRAYLFKFDKNHPYITEFRPDNYLPDESLIISAGSVLVIGLIGLLFYFKHRRREEGVSANASMPLDSVQNRPVKIYLDDDRNITVLINGDRFQMADDKAMKILWVTLAEMTETGESSILVSNVDQRIYPDQSHPSQNSRNRKKLIKIINTACGFDLISEERSEIDKRYKVLTIQTDKICIKDN